MQRRKFVKDAAFLAMGLTAASFGFAGIRDYYAENGRALDLKDLAGVSSKLEADFRQLLQWMKSNGWTAYLTDTLGVNLDAGGDALRKELIKPINRKRLDALRQNAQSGYDDFSGERLVQPGFPAFSLLYHSLASPRVRPQAVHAYPSLQQIDLLENYVYALSSWEQLSSIHGIKKGETLVFAVFAYEYRPAFKTPHHAYADVVYSRTGIARIGDQPLNYDAVNRCHSNAPADAAYIKHAAVVPARYGLFLARKVKHDDIALLKEEYHKGDDSKDDRSDDQKHFLQPIRKIFDDDELVGGGGIKFSEQHKSEKLQKLSRVKGITIWPGRKPQPRHSKDLIVQDKKIRQAGSSFLVISRSAPLIRPAREDGHIVYFLVPEHATDPFDNRYFTAFCTQKVEDVELLQGYENLGRIFNDYESPRNKPLFVNITNEQKDDTTFQPIPQTGDGSFERKVCQGNYYAPLFEDSICDGSVRADVSSFRLDKLAGVKAHCLPAFSVVTAPDFFPQVDPLDFASYDIAPGTGRQSHFYEGGVASLATARIKPNPKAIETGADTTSDTYLAVLSGSLQADTGVADHRLQVYKNPKSERGYEISGFLPDVASSVFAPGWDVTYCRLDDGDDIYIGTEGLGSPFIEDMKFCSALNGMWPATSPDASRTYQGSNETDYRNPTAVPLLDSEIGICAAGPAGKAHECWGWDGEQGPFLEKVGMQWKVNFTDLGRADAIHNALDGKLDMSKLRILKSAELIERMECLRICIDALPQKNFRGDVYKSKVPAYTYLWLVSAEKAAWGMEEVSALGIPAALVGKDKSWIAAPEAAKVRGDGYLYVFANSAADPDDADEHLNKNCEKKPKDWTADLKRRRLDCEQLYVCQVTTDPGSPHKIAWTEVKDGKISWQLK